MLFALRASWSKVSRAWTTVSIWVISPPVSVATRASRLCTQAVVQVRHFARGSEHHDRNQFQLVVSLHGFQHFQPAGATIKLYALNVLHNSNRQIPAVSIVKRIGRAASDRSLSKGINQDGYMPRKQISSDEMSLTFANERAAMPFLPS
jgi:hypothetical protein